MKESIQSEEIICNALSALKNIKWPFIDGTNMDDNTLHP